MTAQDVGSGAGLNEAAARHSGACV